MYHVRKHNFYLIKLNQNSKHAHRNQYVQPEFKKKTVTNVSPTPQLGASTLELTAQARQNVQRRNRNVLTNLSKIPQCNKT